VTTTPTFASETLTGTISAGPLLTLIDISSTAVTPRANTAMQIVGKDGGASRLEIVSFGTATFPDTLFRGAAGTSASPTAVHLNQSIGQFTFSGYDGSAFNTTQGTVTFIATENWVSGSNLGLKAQIVVNNTGTTTQSTYTFKDGNLAVPGATLTVGGTEVALVPGAGLVSSNGTILEDTTIVGGTWSGGTLTVTGVSNAFLLSMAGANAALIHGGLH
jgi:hypothetical protein